MMGMAQHQSGPQQFNISEPDVDESEYVPKPLEKLVAWSKSPNIASDKQFQKDFDDTWLSDLGAKVVREFEIDWGSAEEWRTTHEKAMKIARQVIEEKNTPWPGAANVKYPLITVASIQFAARAYPEIIKGDDVVKCRVKGEDPDGQKKKIGERVADHMSWQLTEEMEDWEEDTDRLLHVLPNVGFLYRKTYYNPILGANVSEVVLPDIGVCHYKTKNLKTCRRFTEIQTYFKNDIREFVAVQLWLDPDIESLVSEGEHAGEDDDPPYEFLEQHRYLDLDKDGYEEPYVVTVHRASSKVVRIVARFDEEDITYNADNKIIKITADSYYTKIPFIPAPDGSFYDVGWGRLLMASNEVINTLSNQLLDSGTLGNMGGGFISNQIQLGKKSGGTVTFKPGEWKQVNSGSAALKDAIFPFPAPEPSKVLFQLLAASIESGKEIAQTQAANLGGPQPANTPAATALSQVEQGQQVYAAIFKRIYRAFKMEFKRLFQLNVKYGKSQVEFHFKDKGQTVFLTDYKEKSYDIVPVADPKLTSDIQRIARAQATMGASGRPHVNEDIITGLYLEAVNPDHKNEIMAPPMGPNGQPGQWPVPLPMRELAMEEKRLELEQIAVLTKAEEAKVKMRQIEANAILALARARDISDSDSMEKLEALLNQIEADKKRQHEMDMAGQSAVQQQQMQQQAAMQNQQGRPQGGQGN